MALRTTVPCPNCGKLVPWVPESRWRPFCTERCWLIDLGEWFKEGRSIPAGEAPEGGSEDGQD